MKLVVDYSGLYSSHDASCLKRKRDAEIKERAQSKKNRHSHNELLVTEQHAIRSFVPSRQPPREEEGRMSEEEIDNDEEIVTGTQDLLDGSANMDGFKRMARCRMALDILDRSGWKRSYFQRKFHDAFMAACARAFFKIEGPGAFQRAFQKILEINGWNNLNQVFCRPCHVA